MAATRQDISRWFDRGVEQSATHLIVVCDTYDYEDFPVYVQPGQDTREIADRESRRPMQKVMEVYALHLDKEAQLAQRRAFHYDSAGV